MQRFGAAGVDVLDLTAEYVCYRAAGCVFY